MKLLGTEVVVQLVNQQILSTEPVLSEEEREMLCKPVDAQEVKDALWSIDAMKAPGPDGFSSGFYKATWDIVADDVVEAISDFFKSGKLLQQVNATNIYLVPKVQNPTKVSDFRPISCCNVLYKIITKIMANRMQAILGRIISFNRAAFVPGRSIISNILVCEDLVRNYHRNDSPPRCLMKIDLRKAYDSVELSFLRQVMAGLGFPACFINWIMCCLSSAHYSILINGSPHGYFKGKRGLRQGDSISPYLFVIGMEYLTRLLNQAEQVTEFQFHAHSQDMMLNHLSFDDDLMLVSRADSFSPAWLKQQLDLFSASSGLLANLSKIQVFICGAEESTKATIEQQLQFTLGDLPIRYLGVPLLASRLSYNDCLPILEKIKVKISTWMN